jgi:predicted RNA binding protein YcfA (HicA-like mRNA interferase family)
MGKIPRPSGKKMLRFAIGLGFSLARVRGSHHYIEKGDAKTCIPIHGNQTLKTGTLGTILREMKLDPKEFEKLWQEQ